jgi:hypothetical protein
VSAAAEKAENTPTACTLSNVAPASSVTVTFRVAVVPTNTFPNATLVGLAENAAAEPTNVKQTTATAAAALRSRIDLRISLSPS